MPEPPKPDLNIRDIADVVKVFDYVFEIGSIKGLSNIRNILFLRDRLDAFVTGSGYEASQSPAQANEVSGVNSDTSELQEAEVPR